MTSRHGADSGALPSGLLLAYYGDDFTGSTDAMEVMTAAGLSTVLFLRTPDAALLGRFPDARCVGIAGSSRGRSPQWMEQHLPPAFEMLAALRPPLMQYKVCSTFDSSADTGSIGRAIDLGVRVMPGDWSPMVVGAPRLKRYQMFGNLFAAVDGVGYRLDRHPTMARHPVTPMDEADLRRHLGKQTSRRVELVDMLQLRDGGAAAHTRLQDLRGDDRPVVLVDVLDEETLREAGRLVWEGKGAGAFSASSSGLQYALAAYWRARGWIAAQPSLPQAGTVPVIAAVSGSCSPVTAGQIAWAREHGFAAERMDLPAVLGALSREAELVRLVQRAGEAIRAGRSPLVFSAEGPDDASVTGFDAIARGAGMPRAEAARSVGVALAEVMRRILDAHPLKRIAIAGGDSSGEVASALDIAALSVCAGLAPGAPLCRAWSDNPRRDGLELVLKGGQVGARSFFGDVLEGQPAG
ncbi:four-carbon acid sugar kinase family protein [Herbaspirillum sp. LeCh32-8]|uniref:3-oxo-isoapionate kinase OiaK n=1 Tax=Herbaspirillum sp. LeCh32-8 TaxID=2821356 RepID=UPI001AE58708|nr:3-oxo-isoapionate kinase OiaK [Herbaspirillum sp. LeCh32-8]MBP0599785.1 four-carbon acid sugar kinase family protein [Herbaspirillum sp. LeCh32-8]